MKTEVGRCPISLMNRTSAVRRRYWLSDITDESDNRRLAWALVVRLMSPQKKASQAETNFCLRGFRLFRFVGTLDPSLR